MNGWHDSVNIAARARIEKYRSEAEVAREVRAAREAQPPSGRFAFARRRTARVIHRIADAIAPQSSLDGTEPVRRSERRPLL
jgi:hypothetical protein